MPSKLKPALIGGGIMAVLSTLPIINMGNCLCCMWVLLGGAVGAYFYARELPDDTPIQSGDGALVGLLSGIFGALFGTFLGYFFMAMGGVNPAREIVADILAERSDISPEVEDILEALQDEGFVSPFFVFIGLFFSAVINSIFGTIGGIIGAAIFRKKTPAATVTDGSDSNP